MVSNKSPHTEPLSPRQRHILRRQVLACAVTTVILAATALFFLGSALDPRAASKQTVFGLFIVFPGVMSVVIGRFGVQYVRDLRLGHALTTRAKVTDILYRHGLPTHIVLDGLGTLSLRIDRLPAVDVSGIARGHRVTVQYSPHSRTVWHVHQ